MSNKPKVQLIGADSNAFIIMGLCKRAAKKAKWSKKKIDEVIDEMTSDDYDHLLATAIKHFDVS